MTIYKLEVEFPAGGHDSYYGKVIRGKTEASARKLANETVGDEGKIWEDSGKVSCQEITIKGNEEVILTDFLAG